MFKKKWRSDLFDIKGEPLSVVRDSAVARPDFAYGRLLPFVVLDTSHRPDIVDLFEIHRISPPGDVITAWGAIKGQPKGLINLFLKFERPVSTSMAITFDIAKAGNTVDLIIKERTVHLQAGKPGVSVIDSMSNPGIFVEVGAKEFGGGRWEEMWARAIRGELRKRGMSRLEAKQRCYQVIADMRKTVDFKLPTVRGSIEK